MCEINYSKGNPFTFTSTGTKIDPSTRVQPWPSLSSRVSLFDVFIQLQQNGWHVVTGTELDFLEFTDPKNSLKEEWKGGRNWHEWNYTYTVKDAFKVAKAVEDDV